MRGNIVCNIENVKSIEYASRQWHWMEWWCCKIVEITQKESETTIK